jgi:hypothetical protein
VIVNSLSVKESGEEEEEEEAAHIRVTVVTDIRTQTPRQAGRQTVRLLFLAFKIPLDFRLMLQVTLPVSASRLTGDVH